MLMKVIINNKIRFIKNEIVFYLFSDVTY